MSFIEPYADEEEALSEANYLVKHWRGHLPLGQSYWVNGGIVFVATAGAVKIALTALSGHASLQAIAAVSILALLLLLLVRGWSLVGVWRSAGRHRARGGSGLWAVVARGMVVLAVLATVGQLGNFALQVREFGAIALGADPMGDEAALALSADGKDLHITGNLTAGTSARVAELAATAPRLQRVVLSSPGGRTLEAERIAGLVRSRRLDTFVERQCMSACTLILLAGGERSAAADAAIGFHRTSFPGLSESENRAADAEIAEVYASAGLPRAFISKAMATEADDMWFPAPASLVHAKVLTDAKPRLHALLKATVAEMRQGLPHRLDDVTTLTDVVAADETLTFMYRVAADARQVDAVALAGLQPHLRMELCEDAGAKEVIGLGGTTVFAYRDRNGAPITQFSVRDCGKSAFSDY